MEIEKSDIEKILEYLHDNLQSNPIVDSIIAGMLISKDFTQNEKVVKFVQATRSIMNKRRLKKDEQIILYEEMVSRILIHQSEPNQDLKRKL